MTRYDIRIRRKALTRGQIERHKDFRSIKAVARRSSGGGSLVKLVIILVSVILFLGMIIFGVGKLNKRSQKSSDKTKVEQTSDRYR